MEVVGGDADEGGGEFYLHEDDNGKKYLLKEGQKLPRPTVVYGWELYVIGSRSEGLLPVRLLTGRMVPRNESQMLSAFKKVYRPMEELIRKESPEKWESMMRSRNSAEVKKLFDEFAPKMDWYSFWSNLEFTLTSLYATWNKARRKARKKVEKRMTVGVGGGSDDGSVAGSKRLEESGVGGVKEEEEEEKEEDLVLPFKKRKHKRI